jgi:hypothetical protein
VYWVSNIVNPSSKKAKVVKDQTAGHRPPSAEPLLATLNNRCARRELLLLPPPKDQHNDDDDDDSDNNGNDDTSDSATLDLRLALALLGLARDEVEKLEGGAALN